MEKKKKNGKHTWGWFIGKGNGINGAQLWSIHEMGTADNSLGYNDL